jgi:hypothetical protein
VISTALKKIRRMNLFLVRFGGPAGAGTGLAGVSGAGMTGFSAKV